MASFHNFNILSMEALARFNESKFVRFKTAYGENSANKTLAGVIETWRHVVAMRNSPLMFFYQLRSKNDRFISEQDLAMRKSTNFILAFSQLTIG